MGVVHIEVNVLEGVFEPVVGVDAEVLAADNEGVEDSIVLCAAVVLAEEVVFAAQYRGALSLFYGVVVDVVVAVFGVAFYARPQWQGVFDGFGQWVLRGACHQCCVHPCFEAVEDGYGQALAFLQDLVCCGALVFEVFFQGV